LCIGLGVAAGALLLTGAVLGGVARARSNEQEGDPANPPLYDQQLQARGRDGESMATAAYVLLGLGGAAAIADLILWIERLRPHKQAKVQASALGLKVRF
jgi:hypothetical protein